MDLKPEAELLEIAQLFNAELKNVSVNVAESEVAIEEVFHCGMCGLTRTDGDANYAYFNYVCVVIVMPLIVAIGLTGNAAAVFVFTRRKMRSSTNIYLAALAVCDLCVELTSVFVFTLENLRRRYPYLGTLFLSTIPYMYPLALWSQTCSVYMTVSAGVDCFICVWFPKKRRKFCSKRRARFVVMIVVLFAFVYNFTHFLEVKIQTCYDRGDKVYRDEVCMSDLRKDENYNTIYYMYLYTVVMAVGPLLLLSALNFFIIVKLAEDKKLAKLATALPTTSTNMTGYDQFNRRSVLATAGHVISIASRVLGGGQRRQSTPLKDEGPITLVLVVLMFILCNSLGLVLNFLEIYSMPAAASALYNYLIDASNLLVVLNSSVNFGLYYAFSSRFRSNLCVHCCCCMFRSRCSSAITTSSVLFVSTSSNSSSGSLRACTESKLANISANGVAAASAQIDRRPSSLSTVIVELVIACDQGSSIKCINDV